MRGLSLGVLLVILSPLAARAAEVEVREYSVTVDGKAAGEYRVTFSREEGTLTLTCQAEVKVKLALVTAYSYSYSGVEVWKDGRLVKFHCACNDNGKRRNVTAVSDGQQLRVNLNGQDKTVRPDVWLTTVLCLPEAKFRNGPVPMLQSDNAREIAGQMQPVSSGPLNVAGRSIDCTRHRLTTLSPHDVWYDAQERLVRQEWVEDGHRTVMELVRVRR
jgi:hypothetical protein